MQVADLFGAWRRSADLHTFNPPASEDELSEAETVLGYKLPEPLKKFYRESNGARFFGGSVQIHGLQPRTIQLDKPIVNPFQPNKPITHRTTTGLTTETASLKDNGWRIPDEVLVFGSSGADSQYGIWLPGSTGARFKHPVVEIGEIFDTPKAMAVVGTNLWRFLFGWTVYYLISGRASAEALDAIQVPPALRERHSDPQLRTLILKSCDRELPDHEPDPYRRGHDARELAEMFAGA